MASIMVARPWTSLARACRRHRLLGRRIDANREYVRVVELKVRALTATLVAVVVCELFLVVHLGEATFYSHTTIVTCYVIAKAQVVTVKSSNYGWAGGGGRGCYQGFGV